MLLLFGGRSSEHSISCISAGNVLRAIDRDRFDVVPVGIAQDGTWWRQPEDWDGPQGTLPTVAARGCAVLPPVAPGAPFLQRDTGGGWQPMEPIDVVFPLLHGPWGEDGTIQGVLETAGVPYVGSGVLASAVGMDKSYTKLVLAAAGLPVGEWVAFHRSAWQRDPGGIAEAVEALGYPVFVKPCRAGSSVGVSKVAGPQELGEAVAAALREDPRVIAEASVEGAREIECGVLVDADGQVRTSSFGEIRVRSGHDFYTFEAKYLDDAADLIVPADLDPAVAEQMRDAAVRAFEALGCEGLARVDFFLNADGPSINEVNTMPGFTSISMYPRMWRDAGVGYSELISILIGDALARGTGLR